MRPTRAAMETMQLHPCIILLLHLLLTSASPALPILPVPDTAQPTLLLPPPSTPTTIPAFPAQSEAATSTCPLALPSDLLPTLSASCATPSRSRCCPVLAATLYSAFSSFALRTLPTSNLDLPVLPDDSESCVAEAEEALRARGATLGRVNATCGVAYCYCGVRLRRLVCDGSFVEVEGRWAPRDEVGQLLERGCAGAGFAGCNRCLRSLSQLKSRPAGNSTAQKTGGTGDEMECRLMGLTWLLSVNKTRYLRSVIDVLRTFMEHSDSGGHNSALTSCSLSSDDLPFAVGSSQIDANGSSGAARLPLFSPLLPLLLSLIVVAILF